MRTSAASALVAILWSVGCGGSQPGDAAADAEPAPEALLVFVSDRDNPPPGDEDPFEGFVRWELYAQTLGQPPRRLTTNATYDATPACAPDGRKLAYASGADGGGIFVMNVDGTGRRRVTRGNDYQPTWSPSGDRIAFAREGPDGRPRLYVVGSRGGPVRPLVEWADAVSPTWSHGDRIAFLHASRPNNVHYDLYLTDVDGRARRRIFRGLYSGQISWSPGDDRLAVTRNVDGFTRIWIVSVETQRARMLTRSPFDEPQGSPSWSPSGELIAFGETAGLAVAHPDGTGHRGLRSGPGAFERDGETILDWVTYTQPTWCRG